MSLVRFIQMKSLLFSLGVTLFCLTCPYTSFSQTNAGNVSLGLRAGDPTGLSGKYFIRENRAIEGILSYWPHGPAITAMYEIHAQAFGVDGLNWYYGGGGHVRRYRSGWTRRGMDWYYPAHKNSGGVGAGIDAIVGMEYYIGSIPISIGLDIKPTLEIASGNNSYFDFESGLSIRYHFNP